MTYYHSNVDPAAGPVGPRGARPVVSSVRVEVTGGHERVTVWNRGGCSGSLVVEPGDGDKLAALLLPEHERRP